MQGSSVRIPLLSAHASAADGAAGQPNELSAPVPAGERYFWQSNPVISTQRLHISSVYEKLIRLCKMAWRSDALVSVVEASVLYLQQERPEVAYIRHMDSTTYLAKDIKFAL